MSFFQHRIKVLAMLVTVAVTVFSFYVLLDHCFATPTTYNMTQTEQHNFFTGYGGAHE